MAPISHQSRRPSNLKLTQEVCHSLGELIRVLRGREVAHVREHQQRAAGDGRVQLLGDVQVDCLVVVRTDDGDLAAVNGAQLRGRELRQRGLHGAHLGRELGEVGVGLVLGVLGRAPRQELLVDGRRREGRVGVLGDHEAGKDKGLADVGADGRVEQHGQRRRGAIGPSHHVVRCDALLGQLDVDVVGEAVVREGVAAGKCAASVASAVHGHHLLARVDELLDHVAEVGRVAEAAVVKDDGRAARCLVVALEPQIGAVDGTEGAVDRGRKGRGGGESFPRGGLPDGRHGHGGRNADGGEHTEKA